VYFPPAAFSIPPRPGLPFDQFTGNACLEAD
jgi:hypothetical protein